MLYRDVHNYHLSWQNLLPLPIFKMLPSYTLAEHATMAAIAKHSGQTLKLEMDQVSEVAVELGIEEAELLIALFSRNGAVKLDSSQYDEAVKDLGLDSVTALTSRMSRLRKKMGQPAHKKDADAVPEAATPKKATSANYSQPFASTPKRKRGGDGDDQDGAASGSATKKSNGNSSGYDGHDGLPYY